MSLALPQMGFFAGRDVGLFLLAFLFIFRAAFVLLMAWALSRPRRSAPRQGFDVLPVKPSGTTKPNGEPGQVPPGR